MNLTKAIIKRIQSYFKTEWNFNDYPTSVWKNLNAVDESVFYGANIIFWSGMVGHGESPEKALSGLKQQFLQYKTYNVILPRPGTKVPLKFASTENIDKYEKIAVEFFSRVLHLNYYEGFFSDHSCLTDFAFAENEEKSKEQIEEIIRVTKIHFNVDISDISEKPIWKIFERINNKN